MKLIYLLTLVLITSCSPLKEYSEPNFKGKYNQFIKNGETEVITKYHYSIVKNEAGQYIKRTFFPETFQLTSEQTFKSRSLKSQDGAEKKWSDDGVLISEGDFINNEKTGQWKFYARKTGQLSSIGKYENGKKVGSWKNYDSNGRIVEENQYKNNLREGDFIQYDSLNNIINKGLYKMDTIFQESNPKAILSKTVDFMPYLSQCKSITNIKERTSCSTTNLLQYVYRNLKYPYKPRHYGIEGMVISQFVVNEDGSIGDIRIIKGICQDFKEECQRVISNLPEWEAGTQDGKPVKVLYTLPIKFKLE